MEDNFNLNDKGNLNPGISDVKVLTEEEKKKGISDWNNKPINKVNGIKAVTKKDLFLKNVIIFTLIIISIAGIICAYTVWKDGTLLPNLNCVSSTVECGNTTFQEGSLECGDCNCGNLTCPAQENLSYIFTQLSNLTNQVNGLNCS